MRFSFAKLLRHIAGMASDDPMAATLSAHLHEPHTTNGGQAAQSIQAVNTRAIARQQRRMVKEARAATMIERARAKRARRLHKRKAA